MFTVLIALDHERTLQLSRNLHIIISVDTKDILYHITGTLYIHTIGRNLDGHALLILVLNFHVKSTTEILKNTRIDDLAYQIVHILITEIDDGVLDGFRIDIHDIHRHLTASQLLTQLCGILQSVDDAIGVDTTLKAERSIGAQAVTTGRLTNPCGMEVSRLQHHVLRGLIGTTTLSAKDTGDTHGFLGIADGQVTLRELVLLTIERHKRRTLGHGLHHNLVAFHHIGIEGMQGLAQRHHHVVGDIHDIVDGAQTNGGQLILQPIGRFFYLTVSYADTGIALASLGVLDDHVDREVVIVDGKTADIRTVSGCFVAVLLQPSIQVASHTPM